MEVPLLPLQSSEEKVIPILQNKELRRKDISKSVAESDRRQFSYFHLVATIPAPALPLQSVLCLCITLRLKSEGLYSKSWAVSVDVCCWLTADTENSLGAPFFDTFYL